MVLSGKNLGKLFKKFQIISLWLTATYFLGRFFVGLIFNV